MLRADGHLLVGMGVLDILALSAGSEVKVHGVLHSIRNMKGIIFLTLRKHDGMLQCTCDNELFGLRDLTEESSVIIYGRVKVENRAPGGVEVVVSEIEILSSPSEYSPVVISKRNINIALENEINMRPITLRNNYKRSVFKLQEGVIRSFREFFFKNGFTEIFTPKIVDASTESGANVFVLDYFQKKAYLAQSPQFYKQMMIPIYERVFEISHVYRAEKHNTTRHLSEYLSVDIEVGFIENFFELINIEISMLSYCLEFLKNNYQTHLSVLGVQLPDIGSVPCFEFTEAKAAISKKYGRKIKDPYDLEPEEERLISQFIFEECQSEFVFVTHYPSKKRPFYAMDDPVNNKFTQSFDLLFRGVEITTGGQRIHNYEEQVNKMRLRGMNTDDFTHYLMLHRYGCPPHGGLGLGVERFLMKLLNESNIRATSMFPRDSIRTAP